MGTCIIDKIGSLKRNKGEVSVFSTKFFGGRHMHVWSRMSHKAIFLFVFFLVQEWVHTILPTLPIILRVPHLLLRVFKEMKGP